MLSYDKALSVSGMKEKGTLPPKEAFSLIIDNLEGRLSEELKPVAEKTCVGASGNGCQWQWKEKAMS